MGDEEPVGVPAQPSKINGRMILEYSLRMLAGVALLVAGYSIHIVDRLEAKINGVSMRLVKIESNRFTIYDAQELEDELNKIGVKDAVLSERMDEILRQHKSLLIRLDALLKQRRP